MVNGFGFCRVESDILLGPGRCIDLSPPFAVISTAHIDARGSPRIGHPALDAPRCTSSRWQAPWGGFFEYLRYPISARIQGSLPIQTIDYPSANSGTRSLVNASRDGNHLRKPDRRTCWTRSRKKALPGAPDPSLGSSFGM